MIKWCAIQPLIGGMYLGAEEAIGHPAEFILSYPGFGDILRTDKDTGEVISTGNEYSLLKYLDKVGRRPEYKIFNRQPFQNDHDLNPEILNCEWTKNPDQELDYSDMDLVVAVPVCSGLSQATIASTETKQSRNCNMIWIAEYTLNVIKPKCYVFENAPNLMGHKGDYVRESLEKIAKEAGYSICYFKTDTKWHYNCQKRSRTFVFFFKQDNMDDIKNPSIEFEHHPLLIDEYFDMIPKDATQQISIDLGIMNNIYIKYYENKLGKDYMNQVSSVIDYMINNNLYDEIKEFANQLSEPTDQEKDKFCKSIDHIKKKTEAGLSFYSVIMYRPKDMRSHAIMFRSMQSELHYKYNRLYTIRECLWLMGHPFDFELQGDIMLEYPKIGQNVPVKTAKWVVSQAIKNINNLQDPQNKFVRFFDNNKMIELNYD